MSISYELARELKDAGFPQVWPQPDYMDIHDAIVVSDIKQKYKRGVYIPALGELIEAIGPQFHKLVRQKRGGGHFLAEARKFAGKAGGQAKALYPDEAVAKLFLLLKKKV